MHRVLCVFLPTWPTDRLKRSESSPQLPDTPFVTAHRIGSRRLIHSACARAQSIGLHAGMAIAHAQAIVPALSIAEADPASDQAALNRLAAWCLRFSPLVSVCGADSLWIETAGCAHLFGGEPAMLAEITSRLAVAGYGCRAAIAPTPGAAHALAHHAGNPITIVQQETLVTALAPLPIAALRLPDEVTGGLRLLGFDTIGQLSRTPRAPLARRFGNAPFTRLDQALGSIPEPIDPILPPELPRARLGFPEPISTAGDFQRAIALLTQALCGRLERRALGTSRIDLLCHRIDGTTQAFRIGTATPTRDAAHLARLLTPKIEGIDPGLGVERMMLAATLTTSLGARQLQSLHNLTQLEEQSVNDTSSLTLCSLIDTLLNRLGEDHIFRAAPVQSDIPERSHKRVAPTSRIIGAAWPKNLPRPTRLFSPPRAIEAFALLPDHAPARFTWRGQPHRIRRADGPERIFGEWWANAHETWSVRDYFQVEDEDGQRFWLFRRGDGTDLSTGDHRWFLHGFFA